MLRRALITCFLLSLLAPGSRADEMLVDGIAAQVGTQIVLVSEVMELVGPLRQGRLMANKCVTVAPRSASDASE
jgi:hypothetical protein